MRDELREHLLEACERNRAAGLSDEQAVRKAIEDFGKPEEVRDGLQAVYGRQLVNVLIEKAMQWKEKNMKTGWKWSFVAHLALGLIIICQIVLITAMLVLIAPIVIARYDLLAQQLPEYLKTYLHLFRSYFLEIWPVWLILVGLGWTLFELKCHAEHKSVIRLAIGTLCCLALAILTLITSVLFISPEWSLFKLERAQYPETVVLDHAQQVASAYQELDRTIKNRNWEGVNDSAFTLQCALQSLDHAGSAAPVLTSMDRRKNIEEIRSLLSELTHITEDIRSVVKRPADREILAPRYFSKLQGLYSELRSTAPGWPRGDSSRQPRPPLR